MKKNTHPQYFEDLKITCACGNIIIAGSTKKELRTEICSACHPFYTGKQKLVDTAGRVDKFMAKVKKTQELKEKKVKLASDLKAEKIEKAMSGEPSKKKASTKKSKKK